MAHQIESAMFVKTGAWHQLGRVVEEAPSTAEGIQLAGLDWEVELAPLFLAGGTVPVSHKAVVRQSDAKVLGVVGPQWRPLQNRDAFKWFDPFLTQKEAALEAAGSLQGGKRVWVLAKLNRDPLVIVPGDEVTKYLLLSNSHDGSLAVRVGFTPIRVVCANTLAMAHKDGGGQLIRFKHSSSLMTNLENVRDTVDAINARFEATAEQYRLLVRKDINQADLRRYVRTVLHADDDSTKCSTRMNNIVEQVGMLFETGKGNDLPAVRGTLWAGYNAVTAYLSHERGNDDARRLDSLWYGDGATTSARALEMALAMAL